MCYNRFKGLLSGCSPAMGGQACIFCLLIKARPPVPSGGLYVFVLLYCCPFVSEYPAGLSVSLDFEQFDLSRLICLAVAPPWAGRRAYSMAQSEFVSLYRETIPNLPFRKVLSRRWFLLVYKHGGFAYSNILSAKKIIIQLQKTT